MSMQAKDGATNVGGLADEETIIPGDRSRQRLQALGALTLSGWSVADVLLTVYFLVTNVRFSQLAPRRKTVLEGLA